MCGRVRLSSDVSEIKLVFSIPPHRPTPNFAPAWNAAPTDPVPIVRYAKAGERSLDGCPEMPEGTILTPTGIPANFSQNLPHRTE